MFVAALGSGVVEDSDVRTVEGTVLFVDVATMEGKGKAQKDSSSGYPTCAVFGSGDLCYVGMSGGSVQVLDAAKCSYESTVTEGIGGKVVSLDVSSDGALIAVGGDGGQMKFFSAKGEEKSLEDAAGAEWVNSTFIYDSKYLEVGGGGVSSVCGGLVGTAGGSVSVASGDLVVHGGSVEGLGKCGETGFWSFSGADNAVFFWGKR